ncbi:SDR family oxidoreductase [Kamptonema cortianum]|nr:SDR family oxidoreductase [Kamptonema cortianum]
MSALTGKTVLITGASRGIGRACAVAFARQGTRVAVHYHSNQRAADETLALLEGSGHIALAADIADSLAVLTMVDAAHSAFGRIDVLVNNAGIFEEHPPESTPYTEWNAVWNRILTTNLIGAANAAWCAARYMIASGEGGRIINISSRTAFRGKSEAPAYAASKAGLNALSQNLAVALGAHRIYVYSIAPGVVETDMAAADKATPAWEAIRQQSPLGRVSTPEDVAHAAVFLASPGAEMLTGGIIDINGASHLRV